MLRTSLLLMKSLNKTVTRSMFFVSKGNLFMFIKTKLLCALEHLQNSKDYIKTVNSSLCLIFTHLCLTPIKGTLKDSVDLDQTQHFIVFALNTGISIKL